MKIADITLILSVNPVPPPEPRPGRRWYDPPRPPSPIVVFYHALIAEVREAEAREARRQAHHQMLVKLLGTDDPWALWCYENYPELMARESVDWAAVCEVLAEVVAREGEEDAH